MVTKRKLFTLRAPAEARPEARIRKSSFFQSDSQARIRKSAFFPQALLAGFSFRTGEYKAFAVRKIAAKPEQVPILHKILPGNLLGNLLGNVPGPFFGKKCENPRYFFFLTFDDI